jgi:hypothetical protein
MKSFQIILLFLLIPAGAIAQEDLLNIGNERSDTGGKYVTGTFMSTRILNGQSVERPSGGELEFRIGHRFGTLNTGLYQFFGLDQASTRLSLDYGIFDWMTIGIARGSYEKTVDGSFKFSIFCQSAGANGMPVSISFFTSLSVRTLKWEVTELNNDFSARLSFVNQILVARKFNRRISIQIAPTFIHRNLVPTGSDPNDLWAMGAGGRIKITERVGLNAEYFYIVNPKTYFSEKIYNPLSVGIDIETAGHVFTLLFTNSLGMTEKAFIGGTTGSWSDGAIHFGFNISRIFILKNPK